TFAASGSHVVACTRFAATVPPVTLAWYQRGAAKPVVFPRRTVCGTHNDSVPPKFVYWFCTIARICRTSSRVAVPGWGAFPTAALGQLDPVPGASGPVSVDSEI